MNTKSITNELNSGEDRFIGETCDNCKKFFKYRLNLFEKPMWAGSYELCRKCTKLKKAGKIDISKL